VRSKNEVGCDGKGCVKVEEPSQPTSVMFFPNGCDFGVQAQEGIEGNNCRNVATETAPHAPSLPYSFVGPVLRTCPA